MKNATATPTWIVELEVPVLLPDDCPDCSDDYKGEGIQIMFLLRRDRISKHIRPYCSKTSQPSSDASSRLETGMTLNDDWRRLEATRNTAIKKMFRAR
jgi:hypothetical protein